MLKAFEEEAATSIMRDNPEDFLTWEEQKRRIQTAQAKQQEIRDAIALLPPYEEILSAMQQLGALTTAAQCGIDNQLLNLSIHCAKDIVPVIRSSSSSANAAWRRNTSTRIPFKPLH